MINNEIVKKQQNLKNVKSNLIKVINNGRKSNNIIYTEELDEQCIKQKRLLSKYGILYGAESEIQVIPIPSYCIAKNPKIKTKLSNKKSKINLFDRLDDKIDEDELENCCDELREFYDWHEITQLVDSRINEINPNIRFLDSIKFKNFSKEFNDKLRADNRVKDYYRRNFIKEELNNVNKVIEDKREYLKNSFQLLKNNSKNTKYKINKDNIIVNKSENLTNKEENTKKRNKSNDFDKFIRLNLSTSFLRLNNQYIKNEIDVSNSIIIETINSLRSTTPIHRIK